MAVAAFKSTSKRTQIGPQDSSATSTAKGKSDVASQNGAHRRTRSLSDFSRYFPEISSSADSFLNGQIDAGSRRDNPLFQNMSPVQDYNRGHSDYANTSRGSTFTETSSRVFQPSKDDLKSRRGRSLSRSRANGANGCQSEAESGQRRGRSVSRYQSIDSQNASNQKTHQLDSSRRGRSLSCCQYDDSEHGMDLAYNRISQHRIRNVGIAYGKKYSSDRPSSDVPKHQRGLRRCSSQQNLSKSLDGYSSCVSTSTDDEGSAMRPDEHVEEKTIRAVYEQMKTFQSDHPTGDMEAIGLYEAMRSEVRHTIAEIRFDLEQAIARKNTPTTANATNGAFTTKSTGVLGAVSDIRKEYTAKLEQSEKRARKLWAQLAVEEQRCQELARIVKELLPDPQLSRTQKPSRTRKGSTERQQMSKCLTEEAQNYFDEFVSLSNLEDSEISSSEEVQNSSPAHGIRAEENGSCEGSISDISYNNSADSSTYTQRIPVPQETDGVVLPWLKWEANSHNVTPINRKKVEIASTGNQSQPSNAKEAGSSSKCSSSGGRSVNITSGQSSSGSWSRSQHSLSSFSPSSAESLVSSSSWNSTERNQKHGIKNNFQNYKKVTEEGCVRSPARSTFQGDECLFRAWNEAILIEKMNQKNGIDSGGLLLCGDRLL